MNAGVEAFRAKLASLGAKNIGIYVGTYFLEEHSISTKNLQRFGFQLMATMTVITTQLLRQT